MLLRQAMSLSSNTENAQRTEPRRDKSNCAITAPRRTMAARRMPRIDGPTTALWPSRTMSVYLPMAICRLKLAAGPTMTAMLVGSSNRVKVDFKFYNVYAGHQNRRRRNAIFSCTSTTSCPRRRVNNTTSVATADCELTGILLAPFQNQNKRFVGDQIRYGCIYLLTVLLYSICD